MNGKFVSILLIDAIVEESRSIEKFLGEDQGSAFTLTHVATKQEALKLLETTPFSLLLLDLDLPDVGKETIAAFKEIQEAANTTPIILISNHPEDEKLAFEVGKLGAQEFLMRDELSSPRLLRTIFYALERHAAFESLRSLSFTDDLTQLYNRRGFLTLTQQQIDLSLRLKRGFFLFFIDLDHLKKINDTYGHKEGDRALRAVADCLRATFRGSDIVGRLGGDEFAVSAIYALAESGERLERNLSENIACYNEEHTLPYTLSVTLGKTFFDPLTDTSLEDLIERADVELYASRRSRP